LERVSKHYYYIIRGGDYRKWYGNNEYVINWANDGEEIKKYLIGKNPNIPRGESLFFKECFTWSLISTKTPAFRYKDWGNIFDIGGMSCFADNNLEYYLALCNSKVAYEILKILAPTINFQAGDIANIPVIDSTEYYKIIVHLVKENIEICKENWDAQETSWNFKKNPLV
jgi:hypothetical protein